MLEYPTGSSTLYATATDCVLFVVRWLHCVEYLGKPLRVISVDRPRKEGACALNLSFELPLRWDLIIRRLGVSFFA